MSTRGSFIIRKGEEEKALYIPYDAYPAWAADQISQIIKLIDVNKFFDLLIEQSEYDVAVDGVPKLLPCFLKDNIVRDCENNEKMAFTSDQANIYNSLFCEYAYVVNLNNNTLEYYEGFQHEPQIGNRYGQEPYITKTGEKYYPCALRGIFSLDLVRKMTAAELIQMMENAQAHNDVSQYRTENINSGTMPVGCIDTARNMIALSNHINIIARDLLLVPTLPKKKVDEINAECEKISASIEKIKTHI